MKKLICCLLFVGVLLSCDNPDDVTDSLPVELDGRWELQSVACFCFYPDDFDFSVHKIEIDSEEGTLVVENSSDTFFLSEVGNYNVEVEGNKIVIKNNIEFTYEVDGDILVLSYVDDPEISDDELSLTYKKIN